MATLDGGVNPSNGDDDWSQGRSPADPRAVGGLADRFSALDVAALDPTSKTTLSQVLNIGEAPESVVEEQGEENEKLRTELQAGTEEVEQFTDVSTILKASINGNFDLHLESGRAHSSLSLGMTEGTTSQVHADNHIYSDNSNTTGVTYINFGANLVVSGAGLSQLSSPSSGSFSSIRSQKEAQYDKFGLLGHGNQPISELNTTRNHWKQNLILRVRDNDVEIVQLRKHLADYSVKEAQIINEKHVLEKRIAYMRLAFDQQQEDLVDVASKALTYRHDIIEENINVAYALQAAQQERSTYMSCLLPLLLEYGFQPSVSDAQSIINSMKVLFKHLQEKLSITEEKLNASHHHIAP